MAFTAENTNGYTTAQLAALNAELASRLVKVDPDDTETKADIEKAFADEISRR